MDGTSDEGLRALQGRLDRLQDELFAAGPHNGRRDLDILRDIEATEALIEEHERANVLDPDGPAQVAEPRAGERWDT